jgi:beta-glucanase (GH16 family)
MRVLPLLLVLLAGTATAADRWQLVWSDEFDAPGAPDPAKWGYEVGKVRNGEAQYYTKDRRENARVEDGQLIIEARKEDFQGSAYTSASLITKGKASWTCGRVAVRAKLPKGRGVWPAIWMLGDNVGQAGWPRCGEIDIMEFVGHVPQTVHGTVHTEAFNHVKHTAKGDKLHVDDPHETWHVYAVEWTPAAIDFLVDDQKYFSFANDGKGEADWPFSKPEYLLLNLAIGGGWGGQQGIDDAIFPQQLRVDWVRVYRDAQAENAPAKP